MRIQEPKNKTDTSAMAANQQGTDNSVHQLADNRPSSVLKKKQAEAITAGKPAQRFRNGTGLPDQLKSGAEALSGYSMDDVKVHYNSDKPAQLNAHAYAQGTDIHLAPGQEKHLPHEAWHVVQQKQGRVKPTMQMKNRVNINDDKGLEKEADDMGKEMSQFKASHVPPAPKLSAIGGQAPAIQRVIKAGGQSHSIRDWLSELDPDKDDPARTQALDIALKQLDGKIYGTVNEFLHEVASITAPLEKQFRDRAVSKAMADREAEVELRERQSKKKVTSSASPESAAGRFKASAKIGLELTFNNAQSRRYVTNTGFPQREKAEAKAWWGLMLKSWTGGIRPPDEWEVEVRKAGPNKNLGNEMGETHMIKVVYTDPSEDDKVVFWWQLSMDPGVIEIQTCPVTGRDMQGPAGEIIRSIYARAEQLEFMPGGGGGHVNVDFETGFGGNYSLIPKILLVTDRIIDGLRRINSHRSLVDFANEAEDPFISTGRLHMEEGSHGSWNNRHDPIVKEPRDYAGEWHRDVYSKSGRNVRNDRDLMQFKQAHAKWLLFHPTRSQYDKSTRQDAKISGKGDKEDLANVLHYQAVNIDHLFEQVTEEADPRRLEFRFFAGQGNLDEIIASIDLIARIVSEAKEMRD